MYLAYQCIDDISDLQPPDNDENADKHTKLSIEVYEDFPTLSRASRRYMVVEFNHHIQPTNPVKVERLPEHVATYHSNSHKKFKDEYRVSSDCTQEITQRSTHFSIFHSNFTLVTKSRFLLVSVIKTYFAIDLGTSQCVSAVLWSSLFVLMYMCTSDDNNRIKLEPIPGCSDCQDDFINASYIDVTTITIKFNVNV